MRGGAGAAAARTVERVSDDIERLERFVARFRYKKTKAKQAQAKLTQIGRLSKERSRAAKELQALTKKRRTLGFEFLRPPRTGRVVLEAEAIELSAGDKELLHGAELALERGEHVGLVGPNGSGKTTLIEALLDRRPLADGRVRFGHGVVPAYFSQHEQELPASGTVLECAQRATGLKRPEAQHLLGRFLFSGWEMHERDVSVLSGGERRRLALALLVASGANLLVLDEPTNHLDLESREALEAALEAFPGTMLLVSHDRAMLDAVPDRLVAIEDGVLRSYDGVGQISSASETSARRHPSQLPLPTLRSRRRKERRPSLRGGSRVSWSASSRRSRPSSCGSQSWRGGSPRTGRTWTCSRRIEQRATSCRRCSPAGKSCSIARSRTDSDNERVTGPAPAAYRGRGGRDDLCTPPPGRSRDDVRRGGGSAPRRRVRLPALPHARP